MISNLRFAALLTLSAAACSTSHEAEDPPADNPTGEYGTLAPIAVATTGLASTSEGTMVGATAIAGNSGCALVRDPAAAPGVEASVVYATLRQEGADKRCPGGDYGIHNDPMGCLPRAFPDIAPNCAVYKRWDATGKQVTLRTAIGGHVSVEHLAAGADRHTCNVELDLVFADGVSVTKAISFDFSPFSPDATFCIH
jgi:hypothetical protein